MGTLDTARAFETPEGVILEIKLAGPVVRACAWAIDGVIRAALYAAISIPFAFLGGLGFATILIGFFLIEWFYPVLFEVHSGATPGKQAMGITVIHDNGTPVAWSSSLIRNLLRAADFLPLFYGFGLLSVLASKDFKRLGDLAAGTLVVYREHPGIRRRIPDCAPLPIPVDLSPDEQQVLLQFAERSGDLSQQRAAELAELLQVVTGQSAEAAVHALCGYANWLARGR